MSATNTRTPPDRQTALRRVVRLPDSIQLKQGEVHSWCVRLDASGETYARLHANLAWEERSRSDRFRLKHDRRRFVVSHGVLRELLSRYLQIRPDQIRYEYNAFGKPALSPESKNRIRFNLSHSGGLALIAIACDSSVGVDIERLRPLPVFVPIAQCFFSTAEVDRLRSLPERFRAQIFFDRWTRMEARMKARGEGLANLDGVSIDADPSQVWSVYALRPAPGYVGALAIEGSGWQLAEWEWETSEDL